MRPRLRSSHRARTLLPLFAGLALLAAPIAVRAATITIVNLDGPMEGFNDPTPEDPVGDNPGTTIGEQRLFVFHTAASIWGALLPSTLEIRVGARFDPQTCTETTGVLGSAGPGSVHRDFANAPFSNTWYHQALANRLSGTDLSGLNDITATFNVSVGSPTCLTSGWYYGIDGNEGTQLELLPVVLHELGHGLGFSTTTSGITGGMMNGAPHVYDRFLMSVTSGLHWNQMTSGQRASSAVGCGDLVWDGPFVTARAPSILGPKSLLHVNPPSTAAGDYEVGQASFGPLPDETGVTADVVLANDGTGVTANACEPIVNDVAGKIVLMDRGGCFFTVKVKNAQDAGAVGVIVADSIAGCPPAGMGGSDPTIVIPAVRITQADGDFLKQNLDGLNATILVDPSKRSGMRAGRVMMNTPNPFQSGSSVSHWDTGPTPDILMEPAINASLSRDVDLTQEMFADIGWYGAASSVATEPATGGALELALGQSTPNPSGAGLTTVRFSIPTTGAVALRVYDVSGRLVAAPVERVLGAGSYVSRIETGDLAAGVYFYSLAAGGRKITRRLVVVK
jgi:PA domain